MARFTIRQRIIFLSAVLLLIIAGMGYIGFSNLVDNNMYLQRFYHNRMLPAQWLNENRNQLRAIEGDVLQIILEAENNDITGQM